MTTQKLFRLWVFFPLLSSVTSVLASPLSQVNQTDRNSETLTQILSVAVGGILTLILGYAQRTQLKSNASVAKKLDDTVPKTDHDELQRKVDTLQENIETLTQQIEMLSATYRSATVERDKAREDVRAEVESHKQTAQQLKDEQALNAELSRTIDKMEAKITELEHRIERAEGINELADRILKGMDSLMKKATSEVEKIAPSPAPEPVKAVEPVVPIASAN